MSLLDQSTSAPSDAELISRVRGGDVDAYGTLFSRHVDAANRLARSLLPGPDADDLVSEAFSKVLNVLLAGRGPDLAFRAYLLTAVRRVHLDRIRTQQRTVPSDDLESLDVGEPFQDAVIAEFEGGAAARAFASLPERWQMVLWHLEVEGQKPAEIAPMLGISPNSVSALAYRAREGLRQAFLQMHAADIVEDGCAQTHELLGGYVRNGLSRRDNARVEEHLKSCRRCTALYLELIEVNSSLAGVLGPLALGTAATAYLAGSGTGATGGGLAVLLGHTKEFVAANTQSVVVGGIAAGVVGAAIVGGVALQSRPGHPVADAHPPTSVAPVTPGPPTRRPATPPPRHHPGQPPAEPPATPATRPGAATVATSSHRDTASTRPAASAPSRPSSTPSGPTGAGEPPATKQPATEPAKEPSAPPPATPTGPSTPDQANLPLDVRVSLGPVTARVGVGSHPGPHRLAIGSGSAGAALPLPDLLGVLRAHVQVGDLVRVDLR